MTIEVSTEAQLHSLKQMIDGELDMLQDRLEHFRSVMIKNVSLKNSYRLNVMKDGFEIDTSLDAALVFLIRQTIRLCLIKQHVTVQPLD